MEEPPSIFDAMQAFETLTQGVVVTANEVALFHVLLQTWNSARRPVVFEQWADMTCRRSGLTKHSLPIARNKLVQKGVISFDKSGRRGPPQYSFTPLLFPLSGNESGNRIGLKAGIGSDSYQEKEKGKGQDKGGGPLDDLSESKPDGIPTIEEAQRFALSDPSMIPPDCVEPWHDDRTSMGWEKPKGQTVVPIRDWRADLRGYGRNWKENRINRPDAPKPPPKAVEGPPGWQEAFREIIPTGPVPVQWNHVDPDLRGEIQNQLKDAS